MGQIEPRREVTVGQCGGPGFGCWAESPSTHLKRSWAGFSLLGDFEPRREAFAGRNDGLPIGNGLRAESGEVRWPWAEFRKGSYAQTS
jgi:hypothetical protein